MAWMLEQAKEELQILETHHPERFDYLKLELKTFISEINGNSSPSSPSLSQALVSCRTISLSTSATTQVSSNRKRKGSESRENGLVSMKPRKRFCRLDSSMDRVDVAIEKAEACLRKIREIKESFVIEEKQMDFV